MRCGDDLDQYVGYAEHGSRGNSRCGSEDEAKGQRSGEPGGRMKLSAYVARLRTATVTVKDQACFSGAGSGRRSISGLNTSAARTKGANSSPRMVCAFGRSGSTPNSSFSGFAAGT